MVKAFSYIFFILFFKYKTKGKNIDVFISLRKAGPVAYWIRELNYNPLGFSSLWFEPVLGHMWESQVLRMVRWFFPVFSSFAHL